MIRQPMATDLPAPDFLALSFLDRVASAVAAGNEPVETLRVDERETVILDNFGPLLAGRVPDVAEAGRAPLLRMMTFLERTACEAPLVGPNFLSVFSRSPIKEA